MTETTAPLTLRTVLRDFLHFLRRPAILEPQGWRDGGAKRWAVLTALLVIGLIGVLLPLLGAWQKAFDLPSPDAFGKMDKVWLVPMVVLIAPPIEELLFRGWQRGSASALWLLGCALAAIGVLIVEADPAQALTAAGSLLFLLIAAPLGWFLLRRRPAPLGWFARGFPAIFYVVAAGFALIHLTNYPSFSLLALPLVLPQLWAALVLGYLRQRLGLIPGILAHMTANACTIALALAGG
ncbi:MAG: CPBP family intramembrane metalloprotease [Proteobacteria bacterium]|nr:CPBP family intramembrane metalloprotease [Pseudomonadota bacterium]